MKVRLALIALALLALLLLAAPLLQGHSPRDIPAGTGYAALDLCSRSMQSHVPYDHVRTRFTEPKVAPLPLLWRVQHETGVRVEVSTLLPGLSNPRSAIFRKGLGCTVVPPGATEAGVRAQRFVAAPVPPADARPWPEGDGAVEAALLSGKDRASLERYAKRLFSEPDPSIAHARNTTALLVARDGHLLFESYAHGLHRDDPQLGWSMTKTLTAMIAGVFSREGKVVLDAPVGLARWKGTPKAAITWRQLLNMAPGLAWFEGYGGASDATQMLFSEPNQGAWAADRALVDPPGRVFTYSTGTSNIAMLRLRELSGGDAQALYDLYQRELFAPLGIRGGVIEPDASGTPVGGARGMLRPVDWLRLGQLLEDHGAWRGKQILPAAWVDFMTTRSPADAGYAGSMWTRESDMVRRDVRAKLPEDLVWFAGFQGQYLIVVPSQRLLVLRMGVSLVGTMEEDPARDEVFDLVAALAQSPG